MLVSGDASADAVLQRGVPGGGVPLAAVAGGATLSGEFAGEGTAAGAEPPVSGAATGTGSRGGSRRRSGARGPARSRDSGRFSKLSLRPARVLRAVCDPIPLAAATFLFVRVPQGVTAGAAAGSAAAGAAAAGDPTARVSPAGTAVSDRSHVVPYFPPPSATVICSDPERGRSGREWFRPSPRFLLRGG